MKYAVLIAACALMSGCGDADEDTGDDTAAVAEWGKIPQGGTGLQVPQLFSRKVLTN